MVEELLLRYRDLKDRNLRNSGIFICEGRTLVLRLLASTWDTESVLCAPRFSEEFRRAARGRCPVLTLEEEELSEIIGFTFHRGVLACGIRRPLPPAEDLPVRLPDAETVVILPDLTNQENVGGIIRCTDALGMDALILGDRCADPFGRKALKTSMGSTFGLPLYRAAAPDEAAVLKKAGFMITGTVTAPRAVPLPSFIRSRKTAVIIGSEAEGLGSEWLEICDKLVTIPMRPGVDSLNAAVAAGIVLYYIKNPPRLSREEGHI